MTRTTASRRPTSVRVRVPASSANLGPGFDALGLALGLHDEVEVTVAADDVRVEVDGEGAGRVPTDATHLVVRAMRAGFDRFGAPPPGLRLRCRNAIPHSRGLGSSAAAAVAGAVAAAALCGRDPAAEQDTLLQVAAGLEGHADNAAASLLGGFVIAWSDPAPGEPSDPPRFGAVRCEVDPRIQPYALIAGVESLTATTRGLLPERVPLPDAAFNAGRSALAVLALTHRPDLLLAATDDRLHQGYRRPAYPATAGLVDDLRAAGIAAAVSGAGPTVLALCGGSALPAELVPAGFTVRPLPVDPHGTTVEIG